MFPLFRMALIQFSYRVEDKIRIKKKKKKNGLDSRSLNSKEET